MNTNEILGQGYSAASVAAENARFMRKVYAWMAAGICLSGGTAHYVANSPEIAETVLMNRAVFWGLMIAQVGAVFALSLAMKKINALAAGAIYAAYAVLTGITLSVIFFVYTADSIASVFWLTAFSFAGLSAFGFVTKKDLGPIGSFCGMGLFGLVGYGLVSLFFPSMMAGVAERVYSLVGVVVFSGLTAYDTQKIKAMNIIGNEGTDEDHKEAIYGALTLYLDFVNLFLSLLRLMGRKK